MSRSSVRRGALTLAVLVTLTGCGTADDPPSDPSSSAARSSGVDLATAGSDLGEIVVDGAGMTVYVFTADGPGESACTDECLTAWPPVSPAGGEPVVDGVTGEVAVITGGDGDPQLTIDGHPVYTYAGDSAAGDVAGQGRDDSWYVVAPDGTAITTAPGSTDSGY